MDTCGADTCADTRHLKLNMSRVWSLASCTGFTMSAPAHSPQLRSCTYSGGAGGDMVTLQGWIYHLAPPDVAGVGGVLGVEVEAAGVEEVLPVLGPGQGGHHVQGALTHLTSHHIMT